MDGNAELDGKGAMVDEPVSLEHYRQRRDLGVEKFMTSLEEGFTEEQRKQVPKIIGELQGFISGLKITDSLEEAVKYAESIKDNKLSLWILGFSSQAFVERLAANHDPRQRDLMAGRLLDNLAARLLKEKVPPQK